jgi:peptidoglycan/LPS O-acetylase OafA/YrhL/lysophospholipase L1-like esterase
MGVPRSVTSTQPVVWESTAAGQSATERPAAEPPPLITPSSTEGHSQLAERAHAIQRSGSGSSSAGAQLPQAVTGLAGVAIVLILLYDTRTFPPGILGVELFLVVCGFLVTLLVLHEVGRRGRGRAGVVDFWSRRLKYVVLSLTITVALTTALVYLLGGLHEARVISGTVVAGLFQVANWHVLSGDEVAWQQLAWDESGRINPLGHLWLVSLLEQLLMAWPLFLALLWWICWRSLSATTVLVWAAFGAAAAMAPMMYDGTNGDRLYMGTDSHAVAFMAGAAVGCSVQTLNWRRGRRDRRGHRKSGKKAAAAVTGFGAGMLALLVAASLLIARQSQPWLFDGGLAVIGGVAALLAAALCFEQSPLFRLFSWGPLVELGKLFYPMYLLHLPIYWLLKTTKPGIAGYGLLFVGGGLTWLAAIIMHYAIAERLRLRRWPLHLALPIGVACAVVAAGALYLPDAIEKRMNPSGRPVVLLTLGDSLVGDVALALANHGADRFGIVDGSTPSCGVMSSEEVGTRPGARSTAEHCRDWEGSWRFAIRESTPDVIVVHLGSDVEEQRLNGRWFSPCTPTYRHRYTAQLERAARLWAEEAPAAEILLMNERTVTATTDPAAARCYNAIVERFAAAETQVALLDLEGFLCAGDTCRRHTPDGEPLYHADQVHLTRPGMHYLVRWLEQAIGRG